MMLNEMGGLRVQATSPSIGAASVRVQGMQGRYTRFLGDGLPLFGQQVGGLGLLQIPPMDLGQVEVIKGVASAFYGAGAMGGVVNLLSRRPGRRPGARPADQPVRRLAPPTPSPSCRRRSARGWRGSLLAGGHRQTRNDRDDDGWADVAGYNRGVFRPRLFFDGGNGRSAFLTAGRHVEDRDGGTMPGAVLAPPGAPYVEALDTRRFDVGATGQTLLGERVRLDRARRGGVATPRPPFRRGARARPPRHARSPRPRCAAPPARTPGWPASRSNAMTSTRATCRASPIPSTCPACSRRTTSTWRRGCRSRPSPRVDVHSEYGTFVSPRLAALMRGGGWTSRVSVGAGFFAATPLTEETEAAGLTRLTVEGRSSRARQTASMDFTRAFGPASVTATVFGSRVDDPVAVDRDDAYVAAHATEPRPTPASSCSARVRHGPVAATGTYTYVRPREHDGGCRMCR